MLEGAGYMVIDLGFDVKVQAFVDAVREHKPNVVGMSGILTTIINMPPVVKALEQARLREKVLVAMGGTSVTEEFAKISGADIYAPDAASVVKAISMALHINL